MDDRLAKLITADIKSPFRDASQPLTLQRTFRNTKMAPTPKAAVATATRSHAKTEIQWEMLKAEIEMAKQRMEYREEIARKLMKALHQENALLVSPTSGALKNGTRVSINFPARQCGKSYPGA